MAFLWLHTLNERHPWLETVGTSVFKLSQALAATSLLVTGGVLGMRHLGLIEAAELMAYDQLIQQQPAAEPDNRLLVVGVTETDLQTLQEWPLSDRTLAQALAELAKHQPQVIGLDIFRDFPHEPGTAELQAQVHQHSNMLMICKTSAANDPGTPPPGWADPEQVAFADVVVDPGGILRRSLLMAGIYEPDTPFPRPHLCNEPGPTLFSLSFKAVLMYLTDMGIEPSFNDDQQLMFGSTLIPQIDGNFGGYQGADTGGYQLMLHYRSKTNAVPQVSLMEVLDGDVEPEMIRDRIVMIGYTTPQSKDEFYTSFSSGKDDQQKMPGVIVHAQSASQLLGAVLDGRPLIWTLGTPTEVLWSLAWSLMGGTLVWYWRHPAVFALIAVLGCVTLYALCFLAFLQGGWLPLVPAAMTFLGTAVGIVSLDRFNNSAYGQEVYHKVKTFLRFEIDIDEEKVEEQVSEITESDYFRDLQETARKLRATKHSEQSAKEDWPHEHTLQSWQAQNPNTNEYTRQLNTLLSSTENGATQSPNEAVPTEQDYWGKLSQDFQATKHQFSEPLVPSASNYSPLVHQPETAQPGLIHDSVAEGNFAIGTAEKMDGDDYEEQYLAAIAQEAEKLQQVTQVAGFPNHTDIPSPVSPSERAPAAFFKRFLLESPYCDYADNTASTQDYLNHLTKKLADIKAEL